MNSSFGSGLKKILSIQLYPSDTPTLQAILVTSFSFQFLRWKRWFSAGDDGLGENLRLKLKNSVFIVSYDYKKTFKQLHV